jgi:hypothetical protein
MDKHKLEIDIVAASPVVAAQPGYFLLDADEVHREIAAEERVKNFAKVPVVAWRIGEGRPEPQVLGANRIAWGDYGTAVLCPNGTVWSEFYGQTFDSVYAWVDAMANEGGI